MVTSATSGERLPQMLAEQLDLALRAIEHDCEVCRVVGTARDALRALSWARFRARHEHNDKVTRLRRLHKGYRRLAGRRERGYRHE
jgi:hypothetical protein